MGCAPAHPPPPGEQASAPLCNRQPRCTVPDGRLPHLSGVYGRHAVVAVIVGSVGVSLMVVILVFLALTQAGCPVLKVAGLTVSNFTVAASTGSTWKAAILVEKPDTRGGKFFFNEVELFLYHHWDMTQSLAVASAEAFVLGAVADRTVIKVKMTMERLEEAAAAVQDMDKERRSVGTVAVGLGLRMRGSYVIWSWWKKSYGQIEAHCNNLKVTFANSAMEGSLVTAGYLVPGDDPPSKSLPPCTYYNDDPTAYPARRSCCGC